MFSHTRTPNEQLWREAPPVSSGAPAPLNRYATKYSFNELSYQQQQALSPDNVALVESLVVEEVGRETGHGLRSVNPIMLQTFLIEAASQVIGLELINARAVAALSANIVDAATAQEYYLADLDPSYHTLGAHVREGDIVPHPTMP